MKLAYVLLEIDVLGKRQPENPLFIARVRSYQRLGSYSHWVDFGPCGESDEWLLKGDEWQVS